MPFLVCSAISCVYNNGEYCSKGDIMVGGKEAEKPQDTCCESFQARGENRATSSMGTPSQTIDVDCKACHCHYNSDCKCTAEKIGIIGAGACKCEQTECGTFETR
ncbi:MAG: DUF1540 domain-containing protein [Eubacteriales bacterium]|nr:DUF1540 domain-containing protein [Eubacteriales bacterium]